MCSVFNKRAKALQTREYKTKYKSGVTDGEYNYCVAGIDADRVFVTGIGDDNDESYMYIRQTNEWQQLPSMPTGR